MKKLILFILPIILFTSCITMVPQEKLEDWAFSNGFIRAEDCPEIDIPERTVLPRPDVPVIRTTDSEGELIPITQSYLMEIIIQLFGTVEKYQYLVEIYEREYLNSGGQILPDLTLEELKQLYLDRIGAIEDVPVPPPERDIDPVTGFPSTGSGTIEQQMTVGEFIQLVNAYNYFQETGEILNEE